MADTKKKSTKNQKPVKKTDSTSEKESSVGKTSKELLDKGLEASKKWFESAKKTISEWGDESVKQVEIVKLNSKLEKGYKALGKLVYSRLAGKRTPISISTDDEEIGEAIKILSDMAKKIKKLGGDPSPSATRAKDKKKSEEEKREEVKLLPAPKKGTRTRSKKTEDSEEQPSRSRKVSTSTSKKTTARKTKASSKTAEAKSSAKKTSTKKASGTNSRSNKTKD